MCDHKPGGTCVRCGLAPIRGAIGGFLSVFGAPNTPTDQRTTARYSRDGLRDQLNFNPYQGVPIVTNPTHYREASVTGKPDGRALYARVTSPDINASESLVLKPTQTPDSARRVTRAQVDPWGSTRGKASWTPGDMAREAVIG